MCPVIKKTITRLLTVLFILLNCIISYALSTPIEFLAHDLITVDGSWQTNSDGTLSYVLPDKTYVKNKFFTNNGLWYFANDNAIITTGFIKYNNSFYYFIENKSGEYGALAVQKTFKTDNGYYSTTKSGKVLKSNKKIEECERYYDYKIKKYVNKSSNIIFNFGIKEPGVYRSINDDVYGFINVLTENGEELLPATGLQVIDGYYYVFDENGKAMTGVARYGERLHYCLPSGERKGIVAIGEFVEDGKIYTTDMIGNIVSIR